MVVMIFRLQKAFFNQDVSMIIPSEYLGISLTCLLCIRLAVVNQCFMNGHLWILCSRFLTSSRGGWVGGASSFHCFCIPPTTHAFETVILGVELVYLTQFPFCASKVKRVKNSDALVRWDIHLALHSFVISSSAVRVAFNLDMTP